MAQENTPPPLAGQGIPFAGQPVSGPVPPIPGPAASFTHTASLLNTARQAITSAMEVKKYLTPGKIWVMRAPGGEVEIKAGILYQNVVVVVVRFDPFSGEILPAGIHTRAYDIRVTDEILRQKLNEVISKLVILQGVVFREPEGCWLIPIVYDYKIISHLKVYMDGVHIVPDYMADQEMRWYGK
ncbi:MAG: hypothetical protein J7L28_03145 [Thermotogae bacterium]|nr:hypothetical protein [Thermotogota bacterium]